MILTKMLKAFLRDYQSTLAIFLAFLAVGSVLTVVPQLLMSSFASMSESVIRTNYPYVWAEMMSVRGEETPETFKQKFNARFLLEAHGYFSEDSLLNTALEEILRYNSEFIFTVWGRSDNVTFIDRDKVHTVLNALENHGVKSLLIKSAGVGYVFLHRTLEKGFVVLPVSIIIVDEKTAQNLGLGHSINSGSMHIYFYREPSYKNIIAYAYPKYDVLKSMVSIHVNETGVSVSFDNEIYNEYLYEIKDFANENDLILAYPFGLTTYANYEETLSPRNLSANLTERLLETLDAIMPTRLLLEPISKGLETLDTEVKNALERLQITIENRNTTIRTTNVDMITNVFTIKLLNKILNGDLSYMKEQIIWNTLYSAVIVLNTSDFKGFCQELLEGPKFLKEDTGGNLFKDTYFMITWEPLQYVIFLLNDQLIALRSYNVNKFRENLKQSVNDVFISVESYLAGVSENLGIICLKDNKDNFVINRVIEPGNYIALMRVDDYAISGAVNQYSVVVLASTIGSTYSLIYYSIIVVLVLLSLSMFILEGMVNRARFWLYTMFSRGMDKKTSLRILYTYLVVLGIIGVSAGILLSILVVPKFLGMSLGILFEYFLGSRLNYMFFVMPYVLMILVTYFSIRGLKKAFQRLNINDLRRHNFKISTSDLKMGVGSYVVLAFTMLALTLHALRIKPEDVINKLNNLVLVALFVIVYALSSIFIYIAPFIIPTGLGKVLVMATDPLMNRLDKSVQNTKRPIWYLSIRGARKVLLESKSMLYVLSLVSSYVLGLSLFSSGIKVALEKAFVSQVMIPSETTMAIQAATMALSSSMRSVLVIVFLMGLIGLYAYVNWFILEMREEITILRARGVSLRGILGIVYGVYFVIYVIALLISMITGTLLYLTFDAGTMAGFERSIHVVPQFNASTFLMIGYYVILLVGPLFALLYVLSEKLPKAMRRVSI
ncbi:MAG: hypothetical protein J7K58_04360 [Euryarchaeota archaeon]|nr:hypothetical protein [Euryarchaeota archaeon]